jgi:hypothetical protein
VPGTATSMLKAAAAMWIELGNPGMAAGAAHHVSDPMERARILDNIGFAEQAYEIAASIGPLGKRALAMVALKRFDDVRAIMKQADAGGEANAAIQGDKALSELAMTEKECRDVLKEIFFTDIHQIDDYFFTKGLYIFSKRSPMEKNFWGLSLYFIDGNFAADAFINMASDWSFDYSLITLSRLLFPDHFVELSLQGNFPVKFLKKIYKWVEKRSRSIRDNKITAKPRLP